MNHGQQSPQPSLPTTPLPSIPLNLAGFLTEESIHVEGDAGNVHFSGHFNIHNNWLFSPGTETKDNPSPFGQKSSFSSLFSSLSPNTFHVDEENDQVPNTINSSMHSAGTPELTDFHDFQTPESSLNPMDSDQNLENEKRYTTSEMTIRTRLRSGAITSVSYVSRRCIGETSGKKLKCRRRIGRSGNGDVLEKMLRRSSFPVRPCSSYAVFVMDKWCSIKALSFEEKSKQLGQMWATLPQDEKKVYVDMAFKDKSRYKKQCSLLKKDTGLID